MEIDIALVPLLKRKGMRNKTHQVILGVVWTIVSSAADEYLPDRRVEYAELAYFRC